jgi:hypothetical protein
VRQACAGCCLIAEDGVQKLYQPSMPHHAILFPTLHKYLNNDNNNDNKSNNNNNTNNNNNEFRQ